MGSTVRADQPGQTCRADLPGGSAAAGAGRAGRAGQTSRADQLRRARAAVARGRYARLLPRLASGRRSWPQRLWLQYEQFVLQPQTSGWRRSHRRV